MAFQSAEINPTEAMEKAVANFFATNLLILFVIAIVSVLDLSPIVNKYKGYGKPAYHPQTMVSLLIYAYMTGTTSSRAIARKFNDSLAYNYLCNGNCPDHSTISRFRNRFASEINNLFHQVLSIADDFDLIDMNECFTDGTKVKANASIHHAYSYAKAKEKRKTIMEEINTLEEKQAKSDDSGDSSSQSDVDISHELKLRYDKLAVLNSVIESIESKHKEVYDAQKEAYDANMAAREQIENETGKKLRLSSFSSKGNSR
jgi:transposase